MYCLKGGELDGVVGIVGCECGVPGPDSVPDDYIDMHLEGYPTRTLVHKDSCVFLGSLDETADITKRFMDGESISNLPDGAEDLIRATIKLTTGRLAMHDEVQKAARSAFEKAVARATAPPKSEMN
jgi:hypothetical protein